MLAMITLSEPIIINGESVSTLEVRQWVDIPAAKTYLVHLKRTFRPLVLWAGADYDAHPELTLAQRTARIDELRASIPALAVAPSPTLFRRSVQ